MQTLATSSGTATTATSTIQCEAAGICKPLLGSMVSDVQTYDPRPICRSSRRPPSYIKDHSTTSYPLADTRA
jgi:hypothetical protein